MRRAHSFYIWRASAENSHRKVSLEGEASVECSHITIHLAAAAAALLFGTMRLREFNCGRRFFAAKSLKAAVVIPGE